MSLSVLQLQRDTSTFPGKLEQRKGGKETEKDKNSGGSKVKLKRCLTMLFSSLTSNYSVLFLKDHSTFLFNSRGALPARNLLIH